MSMNLMTLPCIYISETQNRMHPMKITTCFNFRLEPEIFLTRLFLESAVLFTDFFFLISNVITENNCFTGIYSLTFPSVKPDFSHITFSGNIMKVPVVFSPSLMIQTLLQFSLSPSFQFLSSSSFILPFKTVQFRY